MYEYAMRASLGDDVFLSEPHTQALEAHLAKITGKEAALFVSSGTMSNQVRQIAPVARSGLTIHPHSSRCART